MKVLPKLLLGLLLVTLWGCHRSGVPAPLNTTPSIVGEWVWNGSSGGIAGTRSIPTLTERTTLRFDSNQQFSLHRNDTLLSAGTYAMVTDRSIYSGKDEPAIQTQSVTINPQVKYRAPIIVNGVVLTLTTTQLSIGDNAYDGFGSGFTRIN